MTTASNQIQTPQKKRRRIFLWVFLAIQIAFLAWLVYVATLANDTSGCHGLTAQQCSDAATVGAGIGAVLIIVIWFFVDLFLGVVYGIYRLARRP